MDKTNINYFLSLHQILIPNNKYNLTHSDDKCCKINYFDGIIEIIYIYDDENNKLNLNILSDTIISSHIKRLLNSNNLISIKFNENTLTEFLFVFAELVEKYFNYCSICGIELKVKGIHSLSCCDKRECIEMSYQTVLDNKITDAYKQDSQVFLFLLKILITGTLHPKGELAYKPLPIIAKINNLNDLKNLLEKEKDFLIESKIIQILEKCDNDMELINITNPNIYAILKNTISNNYFSMSSRDNDIKTSKNQINNDSIKFIHINYSADIENKFTQKHFLFHGSAISSWYPIVKNGLKVMSGTEMMAHGAAYGKGIYFSDSFQMSYGYSSNGMGIRMKMRNMNNCNNFDSVVGVFEISEDPNAYKKTPGIFVIDNDKVLLLRTLVLIKSKSVIPKDISNYFLKELPLQKQTNKLNVGILKNKRLEGEYKKLSGLNFITKIDIKDQFGWRIDFEPIKSNELSIKFVFSNYPINPPIIKLLSTNIKIIGLVDRNNNITIEQINPANWKITNNLSDIASLLYNCFKETL
jgi:hypothetical protein